MANDPDDEMEQFNQDFTAEMLPVFDALGIYHDGATVLPVAALHLPGDNMFTLALYFKTPDAAARAASLFMQSEGDNHLPLVMARAPDGRTLLVFLGMAGSVAP